jgi:cephalosporin hydroxylase
MTLEEVGMKYKTDKSKLLHDFLRHYEEVLRDKTIKTVLEIGIEWGASLRMWGEFFPEATVYGLDINPVTLINAGNIRSFQCDQSRPDQILKILIEHGIDPDLVIDDGSHFWSHQMVSWRTIWPRLRPGAIYIVEDLHTSLAQTLFNDQKENPLEFFRQRPDYTIIRHDNDHPVFKISITGIGIKGGSA